MFYEYPVERTASSSYSNDSDLLASLPEGVSNEQFKNWFDQQTPRAPWVNAAAGEWRQGVNEYAGSANNPRILEYHETTDNYVHRNDSADWCAAFVNWSMEQTGYKGAESAWSQEWRTWGKDAGGPVYGAIAVTRRGHTAIVVGQEGNRIAILGGNQGPRPDAVSIDFINENNIQNYRLPTNYVTTPTDHSMLQSNPVFNEWLRR